MKTKKLLSVIISMALILSITAIAVSAQAPTTVYVGGVILFDGEYLASNAAIPTTQAPADGGYAYFNGGVLTLCDYVYEGEASGSYAYDADSCAVIYSDTSLSVKLVGASVISTSGASGPDNIQGITAVDNLNFFGDGTLEIYSPQGICTHSGAITFESGELYIESEMISVTAGNDIVVNSADIIAFSDDMGIIAETLTVNGGLTVAMGTSCGVYAAIYANGGEISIAADGSIGGVAVDGEIILGEDMKLEEGAADSDYVYIVCDVLLGDVNDDGVIDMFDYLIVKSIYFEKYEYTEGEFKRADVNADGVVDMFDYLAVKTAYFKGTAAGPSEDALAVLATHITENGAYDAEATYYSIDVPKEENGYINHTTLNYDAASGTIDVGGGYENANGTEAFAVSLLLEGGEDESMVVFLYYCESTEEFYIATGYISLSGFNPDSPALIGFESGIEDAATAADFESRCANQLAKTLADVAAYITVSDLGITMADLGFGNIQ